MRPGETVELHHRGCPLPETFHTRHEWGAFVAEHMVLPRPQPHDFVLQSGHHYLALLDACRKDGETTVDDLPRSTLRDARGKLIFVPGGCRMQGWAQPGNLPVAFTATYLDPETCSRLEGGGRQLHPILHFENVLLLQMMRHLERILARPESYPRVYVESFAILLLTEVMSLQDGPLPQERRAKGGLAGWQRKAVCDYIEENLNQDVSLGELAGIARLSPHHFCRAFKESTGEPPHRYQMSRRVARAKELLRDPTLSVAAVAGAVGYDSPSRFTTLFRRATGHTPLGFRRQML